MTLQSSGPINFSEIQTEFTGSNPIALSEYYEEPNGLVTENNTTVPQSGTISMSNFYGTTRGIIATVAPGTYSNFNPGDYFGTAWGQNTPKTLIVSSGVTINGGFIVNSASNLYGASLQGTLTVRNYGLIRGTGGTPGSAPNFIPTAGGNAITVSHGSVRIENYTGGKIYGGGGGGGRGGSGGAGTNTYSAWATATSTGANGFLAGGGGGGTIIVNYSAPGGSGVGGLGGWADNSANSNSFSGPNGGYGDAVINSGSGGGGGGGSYAYSQQTAFFAGSGSAGVVIIRYLKTAV
jgi:hypothetical protein